MTIQQLKTKANKLRAQAKLADKGAQPAGHIHGDKLRAEAAALEARAATLTAALNLIRGEAINDAEIERGIADAELRASGVPIDAS